MHRLCIITTNGVVLIRILQLFALILLLQQALFATDVEVIRQALIKKFQNTYPTMEIKQLYISPLGHISKRYDNYRLKTVYISQAALKANHGTFSALYSNGKKEKKRFYKFLLDATVSLYQAHQEIPANTPLDSSMVDLRQTHFKYIRFTPINRRYLYNNYLTKRALHEGDIITTKDLKIRPLIKHGQSVQATLHESGISATFSAKAMQDGARGEIIRIKRHPNIILKAKVLSEDQVEVLP